MGSELQGGMDCLLLTTASAQCSTLDVVSQCAASVLRMCMMPGMKTIELLPLMSCSG